MGLNDEQPAHACDWSKFGPCDFVSAKGKVCGAKAGEECMRWAFTAMVYADRPHRGRPRKTEEREQP